MIAIPFSALADTSITPEIDNISLLIRPSQCPQVIPEPEQADHIVVTGEADAVFLGREMLRNLRWALYAAEKLGVTIKWPSNFERAPQPSVCLLKLCNHSEGTAPIR